jgi:hypothetical protein
MIGIRNRKFEFQMQKYFNIAEDMLKSSYVYSPETAGKLDSFFMQYAHYRKYNQISSYEIF